ncbi:PEP-CTERM sorting domain-containing protein [Microvirga sp. SRT01]|uniref:PEP-CTERM sorting domain-containing protein n=1 Tax=Sphingomonas longa TaxID=2778730 RepID=A0ABS2DBG8_9SPHN|nr:MULTISPECIES: PEPxxWA-CTERM sorting domain-containing protein [Alphaproteobacteria]MBM6578280.1 PEP-CTERM sorting domain-containing protein [Sphingomonas sp. BT552]MBR7711321.1 PEP-CTERM sorting domain-containing protein [Microvirga sp. SRT01]
MRVFHIVATLGLLAASPAFAADIVTITPNPAPSGQAQSPAPFTYRGTSGSRTQQVYASSFFSGPQMLTSLAFRSTPGFRNGANYASVNISLSTTMFGDETGTPLSADFSSNIGSDVTRVYQGAISFAAPTTDGFEYIVNFENAFRYDPSMGNLLLDVTIPVGSSVDGPGFFLASYDTANSFDDGVYSVNSVFDGAATSGIANTAATITQFTGTALAGAVPEPDTWALMIGGFGVVGGAMRRRRVSTKAVFA